jgi:hypothetical protein
LDTKIDDIDIGSPVPRERCASVVRKQSMIHVDETFLPSPTAVSLLVREGPVDKRVLLLHVGRSYRQLPQAIIWLDVHRVDDDRSPVAENLRASHAHFMEYLRLPAPDFTIWTALLPDLVRRDHVDALRGWPM